MAGPSLLEALQQMPDPRSRRGRSYPLPAILALVILGFLMGRRSLTAIAQLAADYGGDLALLLGFPRTATPCVSALSWLLRRLDAPALESVLGRWVHETVLSLPPAAAGGPPPCPAPADPTPIHIDGKTLRGSRVPAADIPGVHLLCAFAPHAQAVLAQLRVDGKTNEHKAALELLNILPRLPGTSLITGDAMFCQKEICQAVRARGDHYLLTAKDNQPGLVGAIDAGLAFAATARSFSPGGPLAPAGPAPARPPRQQCREESRPRRAAHAG
jgi:hypothetical protein